MKQPANIHIAAEPRGTGRAGRRMSSPAISLGLACRSAPLAMLGALGLAAPALLLAPAPVHATVATHCAASNGYSNQDQFDVGSISCIAANNRFENEMAFSSHGDPFKFEGNSVSQASCSIGTCHAFAVTTAVRNLTSYTYITQTTDEHGDVHTKATIEYNPFGGGGADASAGGHWYDSVTFRYSNPILNSDPLAPDITFSMTVALSAGVAGCRSYNDIQLEQAGASANMQASVNGTFVGSVQQSIGHQAADCYDESQGDFPTLTVSVRPGTVVDLHGSLGAGALAHLLPRLGPDYATAIADASNTGHYYIDVLTPDAYYTDEAFAGTINPLATPAAAAVPEPSALALLLAGFGALWFGSRRSEMPLGRSA